MTQTPNETTVPISVVSDIIPCQRLIQNDQSHHNEYGVSTANAFHVLGNEHNVVENGPSETGSHQDSAASSQPVHQSSHPASPEQVLSNTSVSPDANQLLIGDSMIRGVDANRLGPESVLVHKVCVPGMKIYDLCKWLHNRTPSENINSATVHVGVNSCKSGEISDREWADVINLACKAFPNAEMKLSSIIPARGRHNLNNTINPSNRTLEIVCKRLGVTFIDNRSSFLTQNGAPRKALYRDAIHPSAAGTAQLACNLKGESPAATNSYHHSLQPERPERQYQHLPDRQSMHQSSRQPPSQSLRQSRQFWSGADASSHPPSYPTNTYPPPPGDHPHFPPLASRRPSTGPNPPHLIPPAYPSFPHQARGSGDADCPQGPVDNRTGQRTTQWSANMIPSHFAPHASQRDGPPPQALDLSRPSMMAECSNRDVPFYPPLHPHVVQLLNVMASQLSTRQ